MVIAVFVFAFFGRPVWYWLIATRILLLPLIAGLAYELIRFAASTRTTASLMTLLAPGLWLQRLTTREPTLDQLEVSIRALREVLDARGRRRARARSASRSWPSGDRASREKCDWKGSLLEGCRDDRLHDERRLRWARRDLEGALAKTSTEA